MVKTQRFNVREDFRLVIAAYLRDAFRSGDVRRIAKAIGALARALVLEMKSPSSRANQR